jgi:hypothetical protein
VSSEFPESLALRELEAKEVKGGKAQRIPPSDDRKIICLKATGYERGLEGRAG